MKKTAKQIRAALSNTSVKVPKCSSCQQPLVRCACKHNTLKK